jgi:cytochrome c peroxidase
MLRYFSFIGLLGLLTACGGGSDSSTSTVTETQLTTTETKEPFDWQLPSGFPQPREAEDNPMSDVKVQLGRLLFYDTRLSVNNVQSCGSCHHQSKAFTDGLATAVGTTGEVHPRNSMGLTNVVYNSRFNWANSLIKSLPQQAMIPMFGEFPIELGWSGHETEMLDRLKYDAIYQDLFAQAFPDSTDSIHEGTITKAIGAFVSTLISGNSAYDKALYQNQPEATSDSAKRGLALFFSERLECFHCHGSFNFAQGTTHDGTTFDEAEFHNNGLYNINGTGAYPPGNQGLWELTQKQQDIGRFRPPTLRNIELTAPYMHDGSVATLEEVLDIYARGGRLITEGEFAGDGAKNPFKSELINGFVLTEQEKQDVVNFLKSLTDWTFVCEERFSDPYGNSPPHPNCLQ